VSVLQSLQRGELVLLSTDTIVGLHADARSVEAYDALWRLKGYDAPRPFVLLFAAISDVLASCELSAANRERLAQTWPAPLTALLSARDHAPAHWTGPNHKIAARVPALEPLRELIRRFGAPLLSTSANIAGEQPLDDLKAAQRRFPGLLAADLGGSGSSGEASTLVDLTEPGGRVLRPGAAPWPPRKGPSGSA